MPKKTPNVAASFDEAVEIMVSDAEEAGQAGMTIQQESLSGTEQRKALEDAQEALQGALGAVEDALDYLSGAL